MRSIIYLENEGLSCFYNARIVNEIRKLYPDDLIVMIGAGDFSSAGILLEPSGRKRSEVYVKEGADLVLSLPVASVLGGYGKKEFADAALMQNLRVPNLLVIPCVPLSGQTVEDCENALRSYANLMFTEKSGYRGILSGYLKTLSFRDAQVKTVCECIPGSEELLSYPENRHALWLLDAMLQLYYITKVQFIAVPELYASESLSGKEVLDHSADFENRITQKAADLARTGSMERLIDISGSTTQLVSALINTPQILAAGTYEQLARLWPDTPADRIRLFLLKAILGIRKIHMQICGLHTYIPYCFVSGRNPEKSRLLACLEEKSWVPFIGNDTQEQIVRKNYFYLLEADRKAAELIMPQ